MARDFQQVVWDARLEHDLRLLARLAIREDLDRGHDWTTLALADADWPGEALVVARQAGVVAGLPAVPILLHEMEIEAGWAPWAADGQRVAAGTGLGLLTGAARDLLTAERTVLNVLGRLCGVATHTRRHVDAAAGGKARVYDTRKTTPGWRRLEKYAVRQGGGRNHRLGLYDAVLIKDNHLALAPPPGHALASAPAPAAVHGAPPSGRVAPSEAVRRARRFLADTRAERPASEPLLVEVEVDSLEQLREVLTELSAEEAPDIVLLDNMTPAALRAAAALRDQLRPGVELEASGGVSLATIGEIASTGVERVSVGALTHSAIALDVALDWR